MQTDKKANTLWNKSAISLKNYQDYINLKSDRFSLTLIDLLYVSNFKGGNASIHESSEKVLEKLKVYSFAMQNIYDIYSDRYLSDLNKYELNSLILSIMSICNLTDKKSETKIDGFSISYLSALLSAYFPNLIPILDRRVLINLQIIRKADIDQNGQVKFIGRFYDKLIRELAIKSINTGKCIRDIDRELFTLKLGELQ